MAAHAKDDSVRFIVCYQREPHAGQLGFARVEQPRTQAERAALARKTCDELQLAVDLWIDDLGDSCRAAFGELPNSAIVIEADGKVRCKLPWCDPADVGLVLRELAAERGEGRPEPADAGFLDAIAKPLAASSTVAERHDRAAMLAWLVDHRGEHHDRARWLAELLQDAPLQQRAWVERATAPVPGASPGGGPKTGDAGGGEGKR
ncbi:MAG: hypothetical protein IPK26_11345 [Planctomycetes bacterium]|nr:hypothetical protein [Planctomycetota bacterium]